MIFSVAVNTGGPLRGCTRTVGISLSKNPSKKFRLSNEISHISLRKSSRMRYMFFSAAEKIRRIKEPPRRVISLELPENYCVAHEGPIVAVLFPILLLSPPSKSAAAAREEARRTRVPRRSSPRNKLSSLDPSDRPTDFGYDRAHLVGSG